MKTWQRIKRDPALLPQYFVREQVVDTIRRFFKDQGFHEVFTPILVPIPSAESNLEVFKTEYRTNSGYKKSAFLIMSPEYAIKKILAAGVGNCFEIAHCFRNEEEISRLHNPEFTMLEWYRVGANYRDIMDDFENLFTRIIKETNPQVNLGDWDYQGEKYDISLPWPRISVKETFQKYCGISSETLVSEKGLIRAAQQKHYFVDGKTTWEQAFYQIFFNEIEPALKKSHRPMIVYDYPKSQAALARLKESDPRFAERFEVFLAGMELGNCFSELTDWQEQAQRFKKDISERKKLHKTEYGIDEDFINALKEGMPDVSGIAVGVDRLIMLAADVPTVADTMFFPASELFDL